MISSPQLFGGTLLLYGVRWAMGAMNKAKRRKRNARNAIWYSTYYPGDQVLEVQRNVTQGIRPRCEMNGEEELSGAIRVFC